MLHMMLLNYCHSGTLTNLFLYDGRIRRVIWHSKSYPTRLCFITLSLHTLHS